MRNMKEHISTLASSPFLLRSFDLLGHSLGPGVLRESSWCPVLTNIISNYDSSYWDSLLFSSVIILVLLLFVSLLVAMTINFGKVKRPSNQVLNQALLWHVLQIFNGGQFIGCPSPQQVWVVGRASHGEARQHLLLGLQQRWRPSVSPHWKLKL